MQAQDAESCGPNTSKGMILGVVDFFKGRGRGLKK